MLGVAFESVDGSFNKHTFNDWNLKWYDVQINFPKAKTHYVNIPGADGVIDLTQALIEDVRYTNRTIIFSFDYLGDFYKWHMIASEIANSIHGQQMKIILDTDMSYYYLGRVSIDTKKSNIALGEITFNCDVEPYKYELMASIDDWKWDPFNFETDVIREYRDLVVNGILEYNIIGNRMPYIPTFICSHPLKLEFYGAIYDLPAGQSKVLDVVMRQGENILKFIGNGTVSIDYKGGSL